MRGRAHAVRDAGHAGRIRCGARGDGQKRPRPQTHPKRTTRDGAAEAASSRDASNYALGSCCVMQWMLPPP